MKAVYQITENPHAVHAHMTEDGTTPLCGAVLKGRTMDLLTPNCEECDDKFSDELGRMCMHGPLPQETVRLVLDIMYRYKSRYRRVLIDAHQALEGAPEAGVEFQRKHPKPLTFWQQWARNALRKAERLGVGDEGDLDALRQVMEKGSEPYITLKAFVDTKLNG